MRKQAVNVEKTSIFSIVINIIQIIAILAVAGLVIFTNTRELSALLVDSIVCVAAITAIWGAVVDIQQAVSARRITEQSTMLEEAFARLEASNLAVRAQRHDFKNHLQVISSLLEMGEQEEALAYVAHVTEDIQLMSLSLRTANPAVNALLKSKLGECQGRGIFMEVHAMGKWENLPVQGWEMCRVLGNLIDNGMDALKSVPEPRLIVTLAEDDHHFRFTVENNGPLIPADIAERMFQPGFSTKGQGHGMGLSIVRRILAESGGDIALMSEAAKTRFTGRLPRQAPGDALPVAGTES